jgi:hypothetical protein
LSKASFTKEKYVGVECNIDETWALSSSSNSVT